MNSETDPQGQASALAASAGGTPRGPAAALLAATPLTAGEVLYGGTQDAAFAAAYLPRNPKATIRTAATRAAGDPPADAAVFESAAELAQALQPPAWRLSSAGVLVVATDAAGGPAARAALARAGLEIVKRQATDAGEVLVAAPPGREPPPLHVELWAFAPLLMDVRTRLPVEQLNSAPRILAHARTRPFTLPAPAAAPDPAARILVLQRPASQPETHWRPLLAQVIAAGWVPVIEHDDHPLLLARIQNREVRDIDWLKFRIMFGVQTSTERLAEAFRAHNPEVKVFPNAVFELSPPPAPRPPRIFYGAVSRGPLAVEMARALTPVLRRRPEAEVVVVGDRAVFDALETERKQFFDYLPYADYLALMRSCSVSLSPLEASEGAEAKSDAKYLDCASSGTLMIGSPTVYAESVEHGVNGLIAQRLADWPALLDQALGDEAFRLRVARAAWDDVRRRRMFAEQIPEREAWYRSLWARRAELEAALCERLPGLAEDIARARDLGAAAPR